MVTLCSTRIADSFLFDGGGVLEGGQAKGERNPIKRSDPQNITGPQRNSRVRRRPLEVDVRSIRAAEVGQKELAVRVIDASVEPRDERIEELQLIGSVTADPKRLRL